jgi:hypothetical protein
MHTPAPSFSSGDAPMLSGEKKCAYFVESLAPPLDAPERSLRGSTTVREGRYMEECQAMRDHTGVDLVSAPGASRPQTLAAGGIAVLLLLALWGAWVLLIGARPCALSYLLWR